MAEKTTETSKEQPTLAEVKSDLAGYATPGLAELDNFLKASFIAASDQLEGLQQEQLGLMARLETLESKNPRLDAVETTQAELGTKVATQTAEIDKIKKILRGLKELFLNGAGPTATKKT